MPRIRLKQPGFEKYTGGIGIHNFTKGLSDEMSIMDAERFGSVMRCTVVEDGEDTGMVPSPLSRIDSFRDKEIEVRKSLAEKMAAQSEQATLAEIKAAYQDQKQPEKPQSEKNTSVGFDYTEESLAAIADAGGIKGLREVADRYDVRGTSIGGLIADLMARKAVYEKAAAGGQ